MLMMMTTTMMLAKARARPSLSAWTVTPDKRCKQYLRTHKIGLQHLHTYCAESDGAATSVCAQCALPHRPEGHRSKMDDGWMLSESRRDYRCRIRMKESHEPLRSAKDEVLMEGII